MKLTDAMILFGWVGCGWSTIVSATGTFGVSKDVLGGVGKGWLEFDESSESWGGEVDRLTLW